MWGAVLTLWIESLRYLGRLRVRSKCKDCHGIAILTKSISFFHMRANFSNESIPSIPGTYGIMLCKHPGIWHHFLLGLWCRVYRDYTNGRRSVLCWYLGNPSDKSTESSIQPRNFFGAPIDVPEVQFIDDVGLLMPFMISITWVEHLVNSCDKLTGHLESVLSYPLEQVNKITRINI